MPLTRRSYHTMIDKHLKPLHHIELKKLKPLHLQAVLKEIYDNGLSDNRLRDAKIIASAVLNFAMDNDLLFRNVFARVSVPKRGKAERLPITEEQKGLILRTWRGHRMGVAVLVMLYCCIFEQLESFSPAALFCCGKAMRRSALLSVCCQNVVKTPNECKIESFQATRRHEKKPDFSGFFDGMSRDN